MMLRKKVDLISECCGAKAIVKDVYICGASAMGSFYYYCTGCHLPCELTGYAANAQQESEDDRIAIEN